MNRILTARDKNGDEVAVLGEADRAIVIIRADGVRGDLERWIRRGISDFVGAHGDRRPRRTEPDNPALFDRIGERLRMYGFTTEYGVIFRAGQKEGLRQWRVLPPARPAQVASGLTQRPSLPDQRSHDLVSPC
jgi:hypothetical protein